MLFRKLTKSLRVVKDTDIVAPVSGEIFPVEQVEDPIFAQQLLGKTISIQPQHGILTLVAPANGELEVLYPGGHAYAVRLKNGIGILVHIGIDTVELKGKGFKVLAKQGMTVSAGQPIVKVNIDMLMKSGYNPSVMMIITDNPDSKELFFLENKRVSVADNILSL